jgi:hypothetical protein
MFTTLTNNGSILADAKSVVMQRSPPLIWRACLNNFPVDLILNKLLVPQTVPGQLRVFKEAMGFKGLQGRNTNLLIAI